MYVFAEYANTIGIIGVIITLAAYYFLNVNKLSPTSMSYLLMNLIGSCFILFSLFYAWNLASGLIESAWIIISLIGIYRAKRASELKKTSAKLYVISNMKIKEQQR